jgi:phosphatidate cytidylyltransferase
VTSSISKYSNLTQRIVAGLLGSAGIIAAVCYSDWTYFLVFFIICLFSLLEFYKLATVDGVVPERVLGTAGGILVFVISFLVEKGQISAVWYTVIFPLMAMAYIIKLYKKEERKPFTNIAFTFLGVFYIAVPFALLNLAAFRTGTYNFQIIFGCLFILWASDTGAYFAGTYLGKTKLFERISPKKSWEGFFGGALLALVFALGIAHYFQSLSIVQWLVVWVIIMVGGTFGDLVESLLKRSIAIKDSGSSIPGHGGFLDRFDGLFLAAPFIAAYLRLF